jgi:hypothetical protein
VKERKGEKKEIKAKSKGDKGKIGGRSAFHFFLKSHPV